MTAPDPPPRWSALRIGPGGIPPEHVRPLTSVRPGAPPSEPPAGRPAPMPFAPPAPGSPPPQQMWPMPAQGGGPSAVLGSFDDGTVRPSRRAVGGWIALALAAAVIVATALWSSGTPRSSGEAPGTGDCLSADDGASSVVAVDCTSGDADFRVVARYDGTAGASSCAAVHPDLVMIAGHRSALCLDYVARVGECLFAGEGDAAAGDEVGKRPCGDAYRGTRDLYRVLAVMPGASDDSGCPVGTLQTLVHRSPREVVCLGFP